MLFRSRISLFDVKDRILKVIYAIHIVIGLLNVHGDVVEGKSFTRRFVHGAKSLDFGKGRDIIMRSDSVKTGMQQAPHRSLFNALGMTKEELERPLVGIVSSHNEIVPGHMNLDKIVEAVKLGVAMAGGTPVVFPAIAVWYSIITRMTRNSQVFDYLITC